MNTIDQVSVFLENRPGQLSELLKIFADNDIDLYALNISETEDYGVLRIIVKDPDYAINVLQKSDYVGVKTPVFLIGIPNELGGLKGLVEIITKAEINIDYMYSMIDEGDTSTAYMAIAVDNVEKMEKTLQKHNITVSQI
ncbi:MAG: ACT domain-containing protein [Coriobacteriia bacterium]|nr:ACT domain-containing protein [Coriobacteriia bacterium]